MSTKIKKIGLLTSGGDAPGMNAAIRAVVRTAVYHDIKVVGIRKGFDGILNGDIMDLKARDVSDILLRGGTMLLTARCEEMMTPEGQEKCANVCKVLGLDALVIIGGDGSIRGGQVLSKHGVKVMGIPATIDLDLPCSEYTIGFDTAVTTAMDAMGKIRDTSSSHERCSIVEVMGRNAGHIALYCGLTIGAEDVLIPERADITSDEVVEQIIKNRSKGKTHNLIVVAEGVGGSQALAEKIQKITGIESRATILGYLQRGGSPTAMDRIHASMMGYQVIELLLQGEYNKVITYKKGQYEPIDLEDALSCENRYDDTLYKVLKILSV